MADIAGRLRRPFAEQVAAFRLRLRQLIPTARWDDIWQAEHDRAFMVAGALKADLLADLAAAVDKSIAEGTDLETFRRDFRAIVARNGWHGWTGEGSKKGEAWRTRVIYKTNMATSYAAGRMAQLRAEGWPLLVYRHGGSLEPRPEHLGWDGLILPADHPFWATHAPPNGWGCSCYITGARDVRDAMRKGGKPGLELAAGWDQPAPRTGAPPGIDRGWAYAPGASVAETVTQMAAKAARWPYHVAKAYMQEVPTAVRDQLARSYRSLPSTADMVRRHCARLFGGETPLETMHTLGLLTEDQARDIGALADQVLDGADWMLDSDGVRHAIKRHTDPKVELTRGQRAIGPEDFALLPKLINSKPTVRYLGVSEMGRPVIELSGTVDGVKLVALFAINPSRRRLTLQSLWVMRGE